MCPQALGLARGVALQLWRYFIKMKQMFGSSA